MNFIPLPLDASLAEYEKQANELFAALVAGDQEAIAFVRQNHTVLSQLPMHEFLSASITPAHAQQALTRGYHFENWEQLSTWVNEVNRKESETYAFETAVDAVVSGDIKLLEAALNKNPELIHARSSRVHHSMLIHYVGANGVESYRQRSPANAVDVLQLLLRSGAEADAMADMYGGSSTFGLVATSIWPAKAKVLIPLMETLLQAGAVIDKNDAAGNAQSAVIGCLHNGRPEAAHYLALKGAHLNLEGAAGVGRLDLVKTFFDSQGALQNGATQKQMEFGFIWACEYGHLPVVEFLLARGVDPNKNIEELSGLHWAIIGGHLDIVNFFLSRNISLENKNAYGGTALGCALWSVENSDPTYRWPESEDQTLPIIETLLKAGSDIEPGTINWVIEQATIPDHQKEKLVKMLIEYSN